MYYSWQAHPYPCVSPTKFLSNFCLLYHFLVLIPTPVSRDSFWTPWWNWMHYLYTKPMMTCFALFLRQIFNFMMYRDSADSIKLNTYWLRALRENAPPMFETSWTLLIFLMYCFQDAEAIRKKVWQMLFSERWAPTGFHQGHINLGFQLPIQSLDESETSWERLWWRSL